MTLGIELSVVVTNHNKGAQVRVAVESAIGQLSAQDELILLDDASDDDITLAVFNELGRSGSNVTYQKSKRRLGAAGAKNYAISLSSKEHIVLLDADDLLPDKALARIKSAFQLNEEASVVFGDYIENREGSDPAVRVSVASLADDAGWLSPSKLALNWNLLGSSPFKKSAFLIVGGFNPKHPVTDDVDFFRKIFVAGFRAKYIPSPIYQWNRSESGNNSLATPRLVARAWFRNLSFYRAVLGKKLFAVQLLQQTLTVLTGRRGDVDALYRRITQLRLLARPRNVRR